MLECAGYVSNPVQETGAQVADERGFHFTKASRAVLVSLHGVTVENAWWFSHGSLMAYFPNTAEAEC